MRFSLRREWSGQSVLTIQMESALRYRISSNKLSQSNKKIRLEVQLTPKRNQWRIQGRGPGRLGPPPYFYTSEARRGEKSFLETGPPMAIPQGVDDRPPPPPPRPFWWSGSATENNQDAAQGLFGPKQARATNCGRDGENKICPPEQWHLTPHPPLPSPGVYLSDSYLSWLSWREGKGV